MNKHLLFRIFASILTLCCVGTMLLSCTPAQQNNPDDAKAKLQVVMDLTDEWNKVSPVDSLVQGCIVVRTEFAEQHPAEVAAFLVEYEESVNFVISNAKEAAEMIAAQGIFAKAAVAQKAIPNCNICFMEGEQMKSAMSGFLDIMIEAAPNSIGGALPAENFYYQNSEDLAAVPDSELTVNVSVLSGTTGFGIAPLMQSSADGEATLNYHFDVQSDASVISQALIKGTVDIAALPTNAAASLYNKTNGGVQLLAINTQGVLYLLDKGNNVESFEDLKGKTVYVPAQNPTFIFQYLCEQNGLKVGEPGDTDADVIINNKYSSPAELQTNVAAGTVTLAVLPEPMVTIALVASADNQS